MTSAIFSSTGKISFSPLGVGLLDNRSKEIVFVFYFSGFREKKLLIILKISRLFFALKTFRISACMNNRFQWS